MALIAWYPLNGNTEDYSINKIHGTTLGTLSIDNNGKIGKTFLFKNDDSGVNVNRKIEGLTEYTMCAWINPAGNHRNYNGTVISSGNWNGSCWAFGVNQTNTAIDVAGPGYNKYISYNVPLDSWTHILCTVKNNVSTLYVNGEYVGQLDFVCTLKTDASNFCIGRETYASGYFSFNGKINDVRIYDNALSVKEIKEVYKTKILHYSFNECQEYTESIKNGIITDSSGFRNHSDNMTLSTSPQWVEDSAIGSGSYKFYNNSHIIRCLQNSNPTDTLTLSAWIKISQLPTENGSIITKDANYYMAIDSTGKLTTYWYGKSSPGYHTTTQTIPLNIWTHVCASWGKSLLKMYINGTKVKEVSISGTGKNSNSYIEIGKEKDHRSFSGNIDDVRVYATDLKDIDVMELYNTRASVSKDGKLFINEIVEKENLFNLKDILKVQKDFNINSLSKYIKKDGKNCIALSATSFYASSTNCFIIPKDKFKENTQYMFDMLINTNLIYQGSEVPGGFRIMYTDGTVNDSLAVTTSGKWKRYTVKSDKNKTIDRVAVYYFIGDLFYCDLDNSFIYELEQSKINKKGQNITREIYENNYKPSLVDYSTWTLTSATGWGNNGTADENCRLVYPNPKGHLDMMWATLSNDSSSGPDGGFNGPQVDIDPSKKYRFSIWIRRENVGTGSGTTYLGCNGYNSSGTNIGVVGLNGTANTNPYFTSFAHTTTVGTSCTDNWILLVGYVHPYTYSLTTSDSTNGAYKMDGTRIDGINDFKWNSECGKTSIRSYLYYSTKTDEIQYFYRPRIDLCDGTEPTIQELLTCNEHLPLVDDNGQYYPNGIFSFNKDNITFSTEFIEN